MNTEDYDEIEREFIEASNKLIAASPTKKYKVLTIEKYQSMKDETAALREENERLKLEKTELYWRSQFSFLQRDYDELEKKHGKENERLKEALKDKDKQIQELRDRLPIVPQNYIDNLTKKYGE